MVQIADARARLLATIDSATTPNRRDGDGVPLGRKAVRTRGALLDAARDVFVERGYGATTVADIAAAAGVSLGAFYQYFRSRGDVMAALVAEGARRMLDDAEHVWRPADGRDGVHRMIDAFVRHYRDTARFQRVWEEVTHAEEELAELRREMNRLFVSGTEAAIRRAQRDGAVRSTIDPALAAISLSAMVDRSCYVHYVFDPDPAVSTDEIVEALTELWCASLGID